MTGPTLMEQFERAQRERWPRLALCMPWGERTQQLRDRGWAAHIVVAHKPIGDPERVLAELVKIESLRELVVAYPRIGDRGAQLIAEHLPGLTSLDLAGNGIGEAGARAIAERLTSLTSLDLGMNKIGDAGVGTIAEGLTSLTSLFIGNNDITALPEEIGHLHSLSTFGVAGNNLSGLPQALRRLPWLSSLRVGGNPRLNLPPEIAERETDAKRILAWYFDRKRRLGEAKVLMVGQGGVGKTSLVNAVIHGRAADPEERKTERIRIDTWTIPSRHAGEDLRVNVWDFGGQEIMHATHQFFLTKRSVYVLVIDARQGEIESNIHYWLQTIQSFGGDSPVMLVINKSDVQPLSLNENGLRRQYAPMAMSFHSVSCTKLQGIDPLREALAGSIRGLAHVDDELPEIYFGVKAALEKMALDRQYVDMADYVRLCDERGVREEREQRRLLRFLHDLGTVLNFDDAESPYHVGDTNILNPEWVTEGVYAIINNQPLMQAQGVLERKRLPEILKDPARYPKDKQRFIVDMMRRFELCFDFAGRPDTLLVPELLSKNEPDVNWKDAKECLGFEYSYAVLPSGLLPRFIVRMHHALTDKPTYWRSGVVLSIEGCKVLVRGDGRANAVRISVDGPIETRRSALAAVRDELKAIHATMPRLAVEERVPLPDAPAVAVPYAHLLELEELARTKPAADEFFPQGLPKGEMRTYSARALLRGVDASFAREPPAATTTAPTEDEPDRAREGRASRRADPKHLAGLAAVLLVVVGGTAGAIVAELLLLHDWPTRVLALSATVVLAVFAFVFLGYFSGLLEGSRAERLLGGVLSKISPLGHPGESEPGTKTALPEASRPAAAQKSPKALPPVTRKAAPAPEATPPDAAGESEAPARKPARRAPAAKRK